MEDRSQKKKICDICAICGKKTEQRDGMMSMEKWKTEVRRKRPVGICVLCSE